MLRNARDQARRKRCGMAAVAAPKICREKERKGRKRKKERRREKERGVRRKRKERDRGSKSERCIVGVKHKHPVGFVKKLLKKAGMEETEKAENIVTEDRLRCENRICILKRL